jgi:hypothetical protein
VLRLVLQGKTVAGCGNTIENLPMLPAGTTFRVCPGVTRRSALGDRRSRWLTAWPALREICVKGLGWSDVLIILA